MLNPKNYLHWRITFWHHSNPGLRQSELLPSFFDLVGVSQMVWLLVLGVFLFFVNRLRFCHNRTRRTWWKLVLVLIHPATKPMSRHCDIWCNQTVCALKAHGCLCSGGHFTIYGISKRELISSCIRATHRYHWSCNTEDFIEIWLLNEVYKYTDSLKTLRNFFCYSDPCYN